MLYNMLFKKFAGRFSRILYLYIVRITRRRLLYERFWDKSQTSFRRFLAVFSAQTVNAAQIRELPNQRNHFFEARVNF